MARRKGPLGSLRGRIIGGLPVTGVSLTEGVHCECADPECAHGGGGCPALACYLWGGVEMDDWKYLCYSRAARMVERGTAPGQPPILTVVPDVEGSDE